MLTKFQENQRLLYHQTNVKIISFSDLKLCIKNISLLINNKWNLICIIKNIGNIGNMKIQRLYFQNSHQKKKKMLWNHVKCAYWAWNHNLPPTRRMHYFQNILWNVVTSEDEIITWTLSTNRKNPHNVKDFASFWSNGPFMVMGVVASSWADGICIRVPLCLCQNFDKNLLRNK